MKDLMPFARGVTLEIFGSLELPRRNEGDNWAMRKTPRESFMRSITVQPGDCEDYALVPIRYLTSLRAELDSLRADLTLSQQQREAPPSAVDDGPVDEPGAAEPSKP